MAETRNFSSGLAHSHLDMQIFTFAPYFQLQFRQEPKCRTQCISELEKAGSKLGSLIGLSLYYGSRSAPSHQGSLPLSATGVQPRVLGQHICFSAGPLVPGFTNSTMEQILIRFNTVRENKCCG